MKKIFAPRKSVPSFFMFATILVAVSIPIVVIGLSGEESFNISEKAYETESPSETNPCVIFFPKVNQNTLQVNGTYDVSVEAVSSIKDIQKVTIVDDSGNTLFEKEYPSLTDSVEETFTYSPSQTGSDFIRGSLTKVTGEQACSGSYINVINSNTAPQITSEEKDADLSVGDSFEYTITAEDIDGDIINFAYSFTPRADWLQKVVIEDGSDGSLKIKLQGTPDKPASYLAHIFVHDGYGNHLNSMSWIINVSQDENDIPVVKILSPSEAVSADIGDEIYTKWLASDLNQIVQYQIYLSEDPSDANTWQAINENISYKTREYNVNTSGLSEGTYRLIIRALDNQTPAGIGLAVSPEIILKGEEAEEEPSDNINLIKPQIINVTPNNSSEVENTTPLIRATLIAGTDATIDEASISFSINDKEITEGIRLNKISDGEITFIYQPEEALSAGVQKISLSFNDSNENTAEKEWTFTILDTIEEGDSDMISIFGIEISKKIALIIGAGITVVLLAILVPIIIYKTWSKGSKDYSKIVNKELPPKIPTSKGMYDINKEVNATSVKQPVTEPVKEEKKTENIFSVPSAEDMGKDIKVEEEEKKEIPEIKQTPTPIEKTETAEEDTWSPKIVQSEGQNIEEPQTEEKAEIDTTPSTEEIPDLEAPSPETFTNIPSPDNETPQSPQTMDEISQLYEEIQKVEKEDNTTPSENS